MTAMTKRKGETFEVGDDWLDGFIPYQLYRVSNRLNARLLGRLRAIGINASQWRVLSVLRSCGTLSVSRITDRTLMEQPTVSRVVNQLEQDGLVSRRPSKEDTRITDVTLTTKGNEAFQSIFPAARRHEESAMDGFSRAEIATLKSLLARIEANIDLDG